MALGLFEVHAGDFAVGKDSQYIAGQWGKPGRLFMKNKGKYFREEISLTEVALVEKASEESVRRFGGMAGWGIAGSALFGPVGLLAGLLAGGHGTDVTFFCQFKDGRKFMGTASSKIFTALSAVVFSQEGVPNQVQAQRANLPLTENVRRCSACGTEISENSSFCSNCGSRLSIKCSACEKEISENMSFCPHCGNSIEKASPSPAQPILPAAEPSSQPIQSLPESSPKKAFSRGFKTTIAIVFTFFLVVWLVLPSNNKEKNGPDQKQKEIDAGISTMRDALTKEIRLHIKASEDFGDYELRLEIKENSYSAILTYNVDPLPMDGAEIIAKVAVHLMLKVLIAQGINPAERWTGVHANVYSRFQGATGKDMVRGYGMASYDFNTDQVDWKPE